MIVFPLNFFELSCVPRDGLAGIGRDKVNLPITSVRPEMTDQTEVADGQHGRQERRPFQPHSAAVNPGGIDPGPVRPLGVGELPLGCSEQFDFASVESRRGGEEKKRVLRGGRLASKDLRVALRELPGGVEVLDVADPGSAQEAG